MEVDSSVIEYKNYGKIVFNLRTVMEMKNLTITQLSKRTGLHHRIIKKYMNGEAIRYDGEVLAKLCFVLECELSDLIKYERP